MTPEGQTILEMLECVAADRRTRRDDDALAARVLAVKRFQHARFARTYSDLLGQPRYAQAARYFLDDLYGPHDFTARDDQFVRIVPALVRLFPHEIVLTVLALARLHALTEAMDSAMGLALPDGALGAAAYTRAWQWVGRGADREAQIALMLDVGMALDRLTRNRMLRHTLRLMRGPARAIGLESLQSFLERGFDTFREMRGAGEFLGTIASRERALAAALFAVDPAALETGRPAGLGDLP